MTEEIIPADAKARRKALLWVALLGAVGVGSYLVLRPQFDSLLSQGTPEARLNAMAWLITAMFTPCFGFAIYFGLLARRIARSGMYPPPGTAVIKDTRVLRGADARRAQICVAILAVLLFLAGAAGTVWLPWFFLPKFLR